MTWKGQRVDPSAIRHTALLTVEGEMDDISAPGQTRAAHRLCGNIPAEKQADHLQKGVGITAFSMDAAGASRSFQGCAIHPHA